MSTLLEARNLTYFYTIDAKHKAGVCDIDISLSSGESVGIVGESGSGKSTIANLICGFLKAQTGQVLLNAVPQQDYALQDYYQQVQYIPQQPRAFFHPKRTIEKSMLEVIKNYRLADDKQAQALIIDTLASVGLKPQHAKQLPHQLSGGECQRASIARALLVKPKLLVCDEITSALDVSVQAEMMQVLTNIKTTQHTTFLFISHDIALVSQFCERALVVKDGHIVESDTMVNLIRQPQNSYTKLLVDQYRK